MEDAGPDAAPPAGPDPADLPYIALTGRYLMRADMYNVGTVKQVGVSLKVANAVTYFSVAQVDFDVVSKAFQMTERLCYQQFQHECVDGCDSWTSQVDARATPLFPYVKRPLTLANNELKGATVSAALGFVGDVDVLPQSAMDARVWDLGGGADIHEGVLTSIEATGLAPLGNDISCVVYTVQRFTSSFNAKLVSGKLHGVTTDFPTAGSEAVRVGSAGKNASSCKSQTGDVLPGAKQDSLRFHGVPNGAYDNDRFWACPVIKDFSDALPAK
jgi:hypothetical protein